MPQFELDPMAAQENEENPQEGQDLLTKGKDGKNFRFLLGPLNLKIK